MNQNTCSVDGCSNPADVTVLLYDVYEDGHVFSEPDSTCPRLCNEHMIQNENGTKGERRPRGITYYPHTNKHAAQGYSIYEKINKA